MVRASEYRKPRGKSLGVVRLLADRIRHTAYLQVRIHGSVAVIIGWSYQARISGTAVFRSR